MGSRRHDGSDPPRRLLDGEDSPLTRLLAAAARPVEAPRAVRERVLATPLGQGLGGRRAWLGAFALVMVGAGATTLLLAPGIRGRQQQDSGGPEWVVSISGAGQVDRGGQSPAPLALGAPLGGGETVSTAPGERLAIGLPSLEARLGGATRASFHRRDSGALDIGLIEGELALVVARRPVGQPLVVLARGYRVEVVGTAFTVRAPAESRLVEVAVSEGVVQVRGPDDHRTLRAGESWSSAPASAAVPRSADPSVRPAPAVQAPPAPPAVASPSIARPVATRSDRVLRSRAPARSNGRPFPDPDEPAPVPAEADPSAPVAGSRAAEPRAAPPTPVFRPLPTPSAAAAPPALEPVAAPISPEPARAPATPPRAIALAAPPPPPPPISALESEETRYESAQALAAAGRYGEAADAFGQLARVGAGRAELALYERGRLLLRHLADPSQAGQVFAEHRRRYPRGPLRPDVDLSLIEALLADGRLIQASQQIEAFLVAYPDSERADEVRLHRGHIAREQGDCRRAREDYDRLVAARGETGEEALYFSAYCARELGDAAGARERLGRYLARFPKGRFARAAREALGAKR